MRPSIVLLRAGLLSAGAALAALHPAHADEHEAWRLFVADHSAPELRVLDAEKGETIETFSLKSPARVYATESNETVFAVQRDANTVTAFSSGIHFDDHGDHADMEVSAPKALDGSVDGDRPVHFVSHYGEIALFFDGEGVARVVSEKQVQDGKPEFRELKTSAPHHGVVIPYGAHAIATVPNSKDPSELPEGVQVVDAKGEAVGDAAACPGLHGEATSGNITAIACDTGLLLVSGSRSAAPVIQHLAYTKSLPEDLKVSTLAGGKALQYFLGNFGKSNLVLIDPEDEDAFRLIELPVRAVHFVVDPVRPKFAYVFTEDGKLNRINVLSGKIDKSVELTAAYSMDGHWSDPRPRIAVTGDEVMVTDPLKSVIRAVDAETFEKARDIAVEGMPYNIVAVGGSGEQHENH
ncbi:metallochaperone AztD [Nitratireductor aquimarinus]|uniref:zinc metallochaperone AztD n=1 Tax=Alphaproteobacteria TaxID=28211 RepID=UPI0019D37AA7|nr:MULTISPECIES: zinc metallochaperone AztD [Alphaproteobacteria]MBN7758438.1 metallochaperone AztD [Nitratireductor aquimarinus]MBY6001200.1 metallochaperone AztD [Tritonibacter mobilis]MBY6023231.1 metallochaperone AztD [Nitratireductor sp. DP7N14-4]